MPENAARCASPLLRHALQQLLLKRKNVTVMATFSTERGYRYCGPLLDDNRHCRGALLQFSKSSIHPMERLACSRENLLHLAFEIAENFSAIAARILAIHHLANLCQRDSELLQSQNGGQILKLLRKVV